MKALDWIILAAIVGIMLVIALTTRASAESLVCFGDSITADTAVNASYCLEANVPADWSIDLEGVPTAPCRFVYDKPGTNDFLGEIGNYGPGDVVVVMCRNVGAPDTDGGYELDMTAALAMDNICRLIGASCVFATQPPYLYNDDAKPWTAQFYDELIPQLHIDTLVLRNDQLWQALNWRNWPSLYDADEVHMSDDGARMLVKTLDRALLFDVCVFAPIFCPGQCC